MADAVWKPWNGLVTSVPLLQEPNDQGPMGCDEDVRFWEGVSCNIVWQQPAGIPFPQGLFATNVLVGGTTR